MTPDEKEWVQYVLTQYLEGRATEKEWDRLISLLSSGQDELETVLVELMAAEPASPDYDPHQWEAIIQRILATPSQSVGDPVLAGTVTGRQDDTPPGAKRERTGPKLVRLFSGKSRWVQVALAAAVIGVAAILWFMWAGNQHNTIATRYSQQKRITLPDQTEIILNGHSSIRYVKRWKRGQPREVWLEGEAFFRVKHLNQNTGSVEPADRFIVHTALADVEVLGTVFNIRQRRDKTEIVLQEGRIKVTFAKSKNTVVMQPGQLLTTRKDKQKTDTGTIKPEEYTAWTRNKLVLTNAAFREIIEYMEDNFGKVVLTDPGLASRRVEGTFQIDNLDDAMLVLSKALNIDIVQRGDTLLFTAK